MFVRGIPDIAELIRQRDIKGLIRLLRHPSFDVQWKAAEALGKLGNDGVRHLVGALGSFHKNVRIGVIEALGEIKAVDSVDPLIQLVRQDEDPEVRWVGTLALGEIGDNRAVDPLTLLLRDPDKHVRYGAALALDKIGRVPSDNPDRTYYLIAKQEWDRISVPGQSSIAPLIGMIRDGDPDVRSHIVDIIGELKDPSASAVCETVLRDKDNRVRWHAVHAFPRCGIPIMHLPLGLSKRPRTGQDPLVAAFLNLLFLGMGYNYLGFWWGFLLFQIFVSINLLTVALTGASMPFLLFPILSLPYSIPFSLHSWYIAKQRPEL
jgi:hypothetical protein